LLGIAEPTNRPADWQGVKSPGTARRNALARTKSPRERRSLPWAKFAAKMRSGFYQITMRSLSGLYILSEGFTSKAW